MSKAHQDHAQESPPKRRRKTREERDESNRAMRKRMIAQLHDEGSPELAEVLEICATPMRLRCKNCAATKLVDTGCRKRWCPVCAGKIAAKFVRAKELCLQRMAWPLAVTLTVRSRPDAKESVRFVVERFFAFRKSIWWKACKIKGGIRGVEITFGESGWHPHLHLLMDCRWLAIHAREPRSSDNGYQVASLCKAAQAELASAWARCIEAEQASVYVCRADKGTLRETIKYTFDPGKMMAAECRISDAIRAMEGTRATQCWGNCHGVVKQAELLAAKEDKQCECGCCAKPSMVPEHVLTGDYSGVAKRRYNKDGTKKPDGTWRPTVADIERLKKGVRATPKPIDPHRRRPSGLRNDAAKPRAKYR